MRHLRILATAAFSTAVALGSACNSDDASVPSGPGGNDNDAGKDASLDPGLDDGGAGQDAAGQKDGASPPALTISHVLLLSIDGMHQIDLANFVAAHPTSTLAKLANNGVQYTNAQVNALDGSPTNPSDSFPGLLALTTGGSSPTTGGWYDVSYARDLYPDSTCATSGTMVTYDESLEVDNTGLWGNGASAGPTHEPAVVRSRLDPKHLPYRKTAAGCAPVFPHDYIRVNSIFEVAHAAGLHTAWSDKHLAYEMVTGPSGAGLDDFFAPEINSLATNLHAQGAGASDDFTSNYAYTEVYDDFKVQAVLNQIDGKWSDAGLAGATDATTTPGTPAIFGMNFQALSVAQKDAKSGQGGYADAHGTPNAGTADALAHTDASIGKMVTELSSKGLLASTLVIVTAKHGQSPIDHGLTQRRDGDAIKNLVSAKAPVAGNIEDDVALYWLTDPKTAAAGANALRAAPADGSASDPSYDTIYTADSPGFTAMFGDPAADPRTPSIVVKLKKGTIYSTSTKKWAEHGGFADDDSNVALLVSNPALAAASVTTPVRTKQVAPTIWPRWGWIPARFKRCKKRRLPSCLRSPFRRLRVGHRFAGRPRRRPPR